MLPKFFLNIIPILYLHSILRDVWSYDYDLHRVPITSGWTRSAVPVTLAFLML